MKKIVGAFLMVFMTLSPPALSIAEEEMYWGQAPPTSTQITDKDFSIDFNKTQQGPTFGDQEIYDTYKTKDLIPETKPAVGPTTRSSIPIQPEPVVRTAPPIRTNISGPTSTQRSTPTTPTPSRVTPSVSPTPAETAPGSTPPANVNASGNGNVESSTNHDDQDRPAAKKMKWGQTESNSEESQTKFQWGKQNQKN
ncbi:MAG: hypothetical protein ACLPVO_18615 [Desulfomonilaceae bacterium]